MSELWLAERIARNDAIFRDANEGISDAAEEFDISGNIPFLCECADEACREIVPLTRDEYRKVRSDTTLFVNAIGHEEAAQEWGEVVARFDGHVIVRKLGRAAEVVDALADEPNPADAPLPEAERP